MIDGSHFLLKDETIHRYTPARAGPTRIKKMTLRKLDYVLYLNARRWLDMHKITIDAEDKDILSKEAIIDITGRDMPVVIRGTRLEPLSKSQLLPKPKVVKAVKKKAALPESKEEATALPTGQRIVFVIAPESNPFSKKEDIAKITWRVPMDGSAEVIIASAIVAPQLAGEPFIRNIKHDMLAYNPLDRCEAGSHIEVIRDRGTISSEVLYDTISPNLASMAKMRISVDPYTFWLDARQDDVVKCILNAEDTCAGFEYRHVTK